jgi:TRAP-type C4-dicarboxylate transport system substrate-binding protein
MKKPLAAAALAAAVALPPTVVSAQTLQYKMASPTAPTGLLNAQTISPWAAEVSKASGGTLEIKVFAGPTIANFGNVYDRTITGVAEIGYAIYGPISSDFPKTLVSTLPFETKTGGEAALAVWRLYEKGLIADEYAKVKLLAINIFPNVSLHSRSKRIEKIADLNGMKVSTEGRVHTRSLASLGAATVTMPVTELYQSLQRGVIEASLIAWPAILTYKLDETTKYHLDVELGNDNGFTFMNKDAYAKLPAPAKQAIDKASGEPLVKRFVKTVDNMVDGAREQVKKRADHVVYRLAPAEEARWRQRVEPSISAWLNTTPNGAAVLAAYREEVKKIRAGM